MDDELTLEDKMAWRRKISSVDASLHSMLENAAAEKGRRPMLSRRKSAEAPGEIQSKPAKRASEGLHLGFHSAST